jgi:hypothetical protein
MTAVEPVSIQESTGYELVAVDRPQLEAAHEKMIQWAIEQQDALSKERQDESANLTVAEERKWATAPFKRRLALIEKRWAFYKKIELALRAGYVIVPNFWMNVFAIRTDASKPRGRPSTSYWQHFPQHGQMLPAGEGEYKSNLPERYQETDTVPDGKGGTKQETLYWPEAFKDVEFPLALAKPALMSKVAQATIEKVFDEIGVAQDANVGRGDPILLGRIRNPRQGRPAMTFFIGWHFDPSRI